MTAGLQLEPAAGRRSLSGRLHDVLHGSDADLWLVVVRGPAPVRCSAPFDSPEQYALLDQPRNADLLDTASAQFADPGDAYAMAKRGVVRAAARAAVAWGRHGGRLNSLAPGIIETPMGLHELEQQAVMKDTLTACPKGRGGTAHEVDSAVPFLGSHAASYVCRIDLLVGGGTVQGLTHLPPSGDGQ